MDNWRDTRASESVDLIGLLCIGPIHHFLTKSFEDKLRTMNVPLFELTSFQRDILYVASAKEEPSGQEIKDELEGDLEEITHGRLYPNLDTLVEREYLNKGMIDRRSNYYAVSDKGRTELERRRAWEDEYVDF